MGKDVKRTCNETVWHDRWSGGCGNTAKHDPDAHGRPTKCGIHCAAAKAKRNAKFQAAMDERRAGWERERRLREAQEKMEPALREIAAGHNDPRGLATTVIAALDAASGGNDEN